MGQQLWLRDHSKICCHLSLKNMGILLVITTEEMTPLEGR